MRLLMAVSGDGFLCRGPSDDMSWTGKVDKLLFRVLTGVGRVCAVGSTTRRVMRDLPGRTLLELSCADHTGYTLEMFARDHPGGWLLGGPTGFLPMYLGLSRPTWPAASRASICQSRPFLTCNARPACDQRAWLIS